MLLSLISILKGNYSINLKHYISIEIILIIVFSIYENYIIRGLS